MKVCDLIKILIKKSKTKELRKIVIKKQENEKFHKNTN